MKTNSNNRKLLFWSHRWRPHLARCPTPSPVWPFSCEPVRFWRFWVVCIFWFVSRRNDDAPVAVGWCAGNCGLIANNKIVQLSEFSLSY